jgi:hypothetical protein
MFHTLKPAKNTNRKAEVALMTMGTESPGILPTFAAWVGTGCPF